jgi:hypothetical protein
VVEPVEVIIFGMKTGDTSPPLIYQCINEDGSVQNITGATEIKLLVGAPEFINGDMDIVGDGEDGTVQYDWAVGDTDDAGEYPFEIRITLGDGGIRTYPSRGDGTLVLTAGLG